MISADEQKAVSTIGLDTNPSHAAADAFRLIEARCASLISDAAQLQNQAVAMCQALQREVETLYELQAALAVAVPKNAEQPLPEPEATAPAEAPAA